MPDADDVRHQLREFILTELVQDPSYPLEDDQPLITGGLIDSLSLAYIAVFIEAAFGVYIQDVDLTEPYMDTLNGIVGRVLEG